MELEGASVLVTGGASGIGEACARHLTVLGARPVIADLNEEKGKAVADELNGAFVKTDVSDTGQIEAAIAAALELGPLRALVNAAGLGNANRTVNREGKPFPLDQFEFVIRVNLIGTFDCLRLAAAATSQQDPCNHEGQRGAIVNIASVAAFDGQIGQAAYSASKGGVVGMTLPIARDLSKVLVRVCTIAPGTFDTPMLAGLPEEVRQALAAGIPNPARLGDPAEYGALACHIVENGYLNAEVIRLDGALRMPPK